MIIETRGGHSPQREAELAEYFASLVPARVSASQGAGAAQADLATVLAEREGREAERGFVRRELLPRSDPHALERLVGARDIMPVSFLERGLRAARAVCRVRLGDTRGAPPDFGTAFLVAPGVVLTNHHVIRDQESAANALFEFDVEVDLNWVERPRRVFTGQPRALFWTDPMLDVTIVALAPVAHEGTPVTEYGFLPLMPHSGKAVPGEYVSIIQHPAGGPKQVVVRENQVVRPQEGLPGEAFLYYRADTEPGSSGAPVFNDQWDVVAVHHLAVQARDASGIPLNRDGRPWSSEQGDDAKLILMNEGVRISAVFRALREEARRDRDAAMVLARLVAAQAPARSSPTISVEQPIDEVPEGSAFERTRYDGLQGYDAGFLDAFEVPHPTLVRRLQRDAAPVSGGGYILPYTHFSVVMSTAHRFALYTAVNIDGSQRRAPTSDKAWRVDPRVDRAVQSDNALYRAGDDEPVDLQRGHLVRRLDPVWGATQEVVDRANQDTFHYTNAAPMAAAFNDTLWGNLEDYILERAERLGHRVSVFTGPIFEASDPEYGHDRTGGPWQLPRYYWKVVVYMRDAGTPGVAAFRMDQSDYVSPLFERYTPLSEAEARTYQEPLRRIERWTGLRFAELRPFDRFGGQEGTGRPRLIRRMSDLSL